MNIKNKKIESIIYKNLSKKIYLEDNNCYINIIKIKSFKENNLVKIYINLLYNNYNYKKDILYNKKNIFFLLKNKIYKKLKNNFINFPKIKFYLQ